MRSEDNRPDELDSLMERALASYTPQEARPGLEPRILASVAAASRVRRRGWNWKPLWALATAAALVAVIAIPVVFRLPRPEIAVVQHPAAGSNRLLRLLRPLRRRHTASSNLERDGVMHPATFHSKRSSASRANTGRSSDGPIRRSRA